MTTFLLRRLALVLPTLFFVSVVVFGLQQLLPGDAALAMAGEDRDPAVIAFLRQKYHLDDPLPVRYLLWVRGVLSGDLGESIRIKRPVRDLVLEKLPVTAELAALAIVIALSIGLPMGILAAVRNRLSDRLRCDDDSAVGAFHPEFLARDPADPAIFGRVGAAAGVGFRQSCRKPVT